MTDFMDTALNYQPGIRIAPDGRGRQWWATNGIAPPIPLCGVCKQFVYEGHVDCSCDKSHPEACDRPMYDELKDQHDVLVAALKAADADLEGLLADEYWHEHSGHQTRREIAAALEATQR